MDENQLAKHSNLKEVSNEEEEISRTGMQYWDYFCCRSFFPSIAPAGPREKH
jgi:hypothetical protein